MSPASKSTVLVTGASSGIGAAGVRHFLEEGWRVSVVALPDSNPDDIVQLDVLITLGDVTVRNIRDAPVKRTFSAYGRIEVLLNNAGIGLCTFSTAVPTECLAGCSTSTSSHPSRWQTAARSRRRQNSSGDQSPQERNLHASDRPTFRRFGCDCAPADGFVPVQVRATSRFDERGILNGNTADDVRCAVG